MSLDTSNIECVTKSEFCPIGYANVNADGTIDSEFGGVSVVNTGVGTRTITPPTGALTSVFTVIEPFGTRDDIQLSKEDFIGTQIHITEQDNGGNPGTLRDRAFSVVYCGIVEKVVIDCEVDELECDGELVSELTVVRPDDTPNVGWSNENLESGVQLDGDVELCFTISDAIGNTPQMIGLDSDDPNQSYVTIDHAFYVYTANGNNLLRIYENGAFVAGVTAWNVGDELCIRRNGTTVTYYVNGALVHTSSNLSTQPLQVGSSFYFANGFWGMGTIELSDISFCEFSGSTERNALALRTNQSEPLSLAASDPLILNVWNTLELTDDHYPILERYEVSEKDLIKYIEKNR